MIDKNGRIDIKYFKDKLMEYFEQQDAAGFNAQTVSMDNPVVGMEESQLASRAEEGKELGAMEMGLLMFHGTDEQVDGYEELRKNNAPMEQILTYLKNIVGGLGTPYKPPFASHVGVSKKL